ncbi:MAG: hypothetical protein ACOY0T_33585 [Myxococcota bacterium]
MPTHEPARTQVMSAQRFPLEWPFCEQHQKASITRSEEERHQEGSCTSQTTAFTPCAGDDGLDATTTRCCQTDRDQGNVDSDSYRGTCTNTLELSDAAGVVARLDLGSESIGGNSVEGDFQYVSEELAAVDLGSGVQVLARARHNEELGGQRTTTLTLYAFDPARFAAVPVLVRSIRSEQSSLVLLEEHVTYAPNFGHIADIVIERQEWDESEQKSMSSRLRLRFRDGEFREE